MLSTDIFGEIELSGRAKILDAKGLHRSSINMEMYATLDAIQKYKTALIHARTAYMEAEHAIRGLDHSFYDSIFAGWERC